LKSTDSLIEMRSLYCIGHYVARGSNTVMLSDLLPVVLSVCKG